MNQMIEIIRDVVIVLQCITLVYSVILLSVNLGKSAAKPNKTQNNRLDALEAWQKTVDARLSVGNEHFDRVDKGSTVMQNSLLAIMDALISGDNKDDLQRRRNDMYEYLTETKGLIK